MAGKTSTPSGSSSEAPQAVEQALGALLRLDREIRPRGVADEQRVAGQDEPRLVRARTVDHGEAAVLRPVPRRMDGAQRDLAHSISAPSSSGSYGNVGARPRDGCDRDAVLEREPAVAGDVVGVRVRLEDADEPDAASLRLLQVLLDRVGGSTTTATPACSSPTR